MAAISQSLLEASRTVTGRTAKKKMGAATRARKIVEDDIFEEF
jgi:hypothetical protein